MSQCICPAEFAGFSLGLRFNYPETKDYLRHYLLSEEDALPSEIVSVSDQEFSDWKKAGNQLDSYAEFCLMCMPVSETLLRHGRCVFHAAAIQYAGRAWLIAAGSGVGKSTQCRNLMSMWPKEFSVINGDKPILERQSGGTIIVHPSPWNGKEGWKGDDAAPLGGIILLRRGNENSIVVSSTKESAARVFVSIFQSYREEYVIQLAGSFAEDLVKSCPIRLLTSHDVPASTELLYSWLEQEVESYGV